MTAVDTSPYTPARTRTPDPRLGGDWHGDKWERQPNETAGAYRAFTVYLHQPHPRTIAAAALARGDRRGINSRDLAARFRWTERAAAYDEHLEQIQIATERAERERMGAELVEMAMDIRAKFARAANRMSDDEAFALLMAKPADAWRIIEGAAKLERELRGGTESAAAEGAQGTAAVQLARAVLVSEAARQHATAMLEAVGTTFESQRPTAAIDVGSIDMSSFPAPADDDP